VGLTIGAVLLAVVLLGVVLLGVVLRLEVFVSPGAAAEVSPSWELLVSSD
jgi:hypothetical protein